MSQKFRILLHGVTGRMGTQRHIKGALLALRSDGYDLELTITGRDKARCSELATEVGSYFLLDVKDALSSGDFDLFFDASSPLVRPNLIAHALENGVSFFGEKPLALESSKLLELKAKAETNNLFGAVIQDKLFTPGYLALRRAVEEELLGEIYDINGDFGYWIETGFDGKPINRPSWNYQTSRGGSLVQDLYTHWNYIVEIVDQVESVSAISKTNIKQRLDENGYLFDVDIPDLIHVIFQTKTGVTGNISSSWVQRPLTPFTTRIFGAKGTLIATPNSCFLHRSEGEQNLNDHFGIRNMDEFYLIWKELLDNVIEKRPISFDIASAIRQSFFCEAIVESSITGLKVPVRRG